jgi:hypothetical protein
VEVRTLTAAEMKGLEDVYQNVVFDRDGPWYMQGDRSPRDQWYYERLLLPFRAIHDSYDTLQDVAVYLRHFPYRGTRVSPLRHLRHNIRIYFEEAYVLRQRLIDYLNILEKDYARSRQEKELNAINAPLCRLLKKRLKSIIDARTLHVHKGGYDDDRLRRLDTLELLSACLPGDAIGGKRRASVYKHMYASAYRNERKRWERLAMDCNLIVEQLIDFYFSKLMPIIFAPDGKVISPPLADTYGPRSEPT